MKLSDIYRHYQSARDEKIVLSFMGIVTQQIMVEYGKILNEQEGLSQNSRHLLFSIYVELTQNILRYSDDQLPPPPTGARGVGIVIVSESDKSFYVNSGNHVSAERAAHLQTALTELCAMDADQLKQFHKERRRNGAPEDSQGAGLGLIEVARRASEPPQFELRQTPEGRTFFSLSVVVHKQ